MKKVKRVSLLISVLSLIFLNGFSVMVKAAGTSEDALTPSRNGDIPYMEYYIDAYDVDITVYENNSMYITETIDAYFNTSKHGIFRKIPLKNQVKRLDGTTSYNHAKISDVYINEPYTDEIEHGSRVFKIGDEYRTIEGKKQYRISYLYELGKDSSKKFDELYYNIIGDSWDTYIGNVTFKITMPEAFDASKLGFSSGFRGNVDSSGIEYEVNDNVITGSYNDILYPEEALTVRLELPEGYFSMAKPLSGGHFWRIFSLALPLLFVGIAGFLWYKYGRDDRVVETIEFYPPEGMNSLDVAFAYKGEAGTKDVTSLLIYLANKGYYKIADTVDKVGPFKSEGFQITRLKEYDGTDRNERLFCNGLFKEKAKPMFGSAVENDPNVVTNKDLYNSFYRTTDKILKDVNKKEHKNEIFESGLKGRNTVCLLMMLGIFLLMVVKPVLEYGGGEGMSVVITGGFFFVVMCSSVRNAFTHKGVRGAIIGSVLNLLFFGAIFFMPIVAIVLPALSFEMSDMLIYIVDFLCIIGIGIFYSLMPKRTFYGNQILGKIRGFKRFLETAEKPALERMVTTNPTYFYDILPYTYVLGVSDKWIEKFETIVMQNPSWYSGSSIRSGSDFGHFMNHMMSTASSSMSSSSSGGSGGGSSGGGSGGGGGGSW